MSISFVLVSNALKIRNMLCAQFKRAMLALQIPEEQQEQYNKGQHLRGTDALNAERVRAEVVSLPQHFALLHAAFRLAKKHFCATFGMLSAGYSHTGAAKHVHSFYWLI